MSINAMQMRNANLQAKTYLHRICKIKKSYSTILLIRKSENRINN